MPLTCFRCRESVGGDGDLNGLRAHLRDVHGMLVSSYSETPFVCGQNECSRSFQLISSLRRHILKDHSNELIIQLHNEDRESIEQSVLAEISSQSSEDTDALMKVESELDSTEGIALPLGELASIFILEIRSNTSVTGSVMSEVFQTTGLIVNNVVMQLKQEIINKLPDCASGDDRKTSLDSFEIGNPFLGINNIDKQVDLIKQHFMYVEPQEIPVGNFLQIWIPYDFVWYIKLEDKILPFL